MPDSKQIFGMSSGDTPDFLFNRNVLKAVDFVVRFNLAAEMQSVFHLFCS